MTQKELNIVRHYGTIPFTLYTYIKNNPNTRTKNICNDLGINRRSLYRHLMNLKTVNIIKYVGYNRLTKYQANDEEDWKL